MRETKEKHKTRTGLLSIRLYDKSVKKKKHDCVLPSFKNNILFARKNTLLKRSFFVPSVVYQFILFMKKKNYA